MTSGFDPMGGDEFPRSHPIPSSLRDASSMQRKLN